MKTVIVAMIGISVVMLAVVIQGSVNMDSKYQHDLGVSLTRAMRQTMKQLEKDVNGNERQQNHYMALLLQGMISRMDSDIELTVKVHRWDANKGELDVEAIGMYELPDRRNRTVAVRRKVILPSGVVAEAASEVKLAVYMPRNGIHHDKDGTYLYTEIESGDAISHYEKTDTSNVVISEKQESFNKGSFNYARISSDVAVVSTNVIRMDGDGTISVCLMPVCAEAVCPSNHWDM